MRGEKSARARDAFCPQRYFLPAASRQSCGREGGEAVMEAGMSEVVHVLEKLLADNPGQVSIVVGIAALRAIGA